MKDINKNNNSVNNDTIKINNNKREVGEITATEEIDYDQLISAAGEFGLYQTFLTFLTFPFYVFGVFSYFAQLFMTEVSPNHWCWVPELENLTVLQRRTIAIPLDETARFGYSQCQMYVANWSEVFNSGIRPNETWPTEQCRYGWEFNKTEIPYPTISSDLGWVCDKGSYQATAQAMFFVGAVFGGFIVGWIADRFGRIPAAVISNVFGCVGSIISVFSKNFFQFCLSRFIVGLSYDSCMMMTYIIVLEFVAPKYRSIMANLPFGVFYTIGAVSLPWIALACGHWKTISLVTGLSMGLSLLAPFIVPESPRWLLTKGRVDDAVNKVITISRVNKKKVPLKLIDQFKASFNWKETAESSSLLDIVKKPVLRKIFICSCLEYMLCMIVFDALVRSLGSLQFDFFLSFSFVSLTEFPSLFLISFILDLTGRKWLSILCFITCCIFSVLSALLSGGLPSVLCAVAARFAVNMCANISMQWGAEMLPTSVRGAGISFIHVCGYVATILSPYIVYLQIYVSWLPLVIVGFIALLAAATALILPETAGRDLPQSFDEAEDLIRTQKLFDVPCLQRKHKNTADGHVNSSFEIN